MFKIFDKTLDFDRQIFEILNLHLLKITQGGPTLPVIPLIGFMPTLCKVMGYGVVGEGEVFHAEKSISCLFNELENIHLFSSN